jgi:AP endonuclease-2
LAAKFWNEYTGKQTLLEKFFGRQPADSKSPDQSSTPTLFSDTSTAAEPVAKPPLPPSSNSHDFINSLSPSLSTTTPVSPASKRKITVDTGSSSKRLKLKSEIPKPKEKNLFKSTIASFFSQPQSRNSKTTAPSSSVSKGKDKLIGTQSHPDNDVTPSDGLTQADEDADYRLALLLSSQDSIPSSSSQGRPEKETKQAWNNLLAPIQPPKCLIHRELAKEFTVTKQSPNKGKKFFICSR